MGQSHQAPEMPYRGQHVDYIHQMYSAVGLPQADSTVWSLHRVGRLDYSARTGPSQLHRQGSTGLYENLIQILEACQVPGSRLQFQGGIAQLIINLHHYILQTPELRRFCRC